MQMKCGFRVVQFFLLACLALFTSVAIAEVPKAGDKFPGGSTIEYPDRGMSYVLPKGTEGHASREHAHYEMLVGVRPYIGSNNRGGSLTIRLAEGDFKAVAAELSHNAVIDGLNMIPVGKATVQHGAIAYNDFKVQYEDELKAFVLVLMAKNGTGLMMTAIAPTETMPAYKKAMSDIGNTVKVSFAANPGQATKRSRVATPPVRVKRRAAGHHAREVVGVWVHRSNHMYSGMYVESHTNWAFGADGTLSYGSNAALAGDASVAIHNGDDDPPDYGHWSSKGDKLFFRWDDGTKGTATFERFNYDGSPYLALTFPDGSVTRYRKID